ncbi:MAG TPA: DUF2807 domain-containing protein [Bacteroidia bacterium]|jgi:hypothetical protein|nr:DUF2807 domain-containing protein [Bacteroidia bacterium]HQF27679.1 DUF2807 domain-containing protein [Bacteroidia bacterium]
MKKISLLLLTLVMLSASIVNAQTSETRELSSFNKVSLLGNTRLRLVNGPSQKIVIENANDPSKVYTKINDQVLSISGVPSSVTITTPSLDEIYIGGTAVVSSDSTFTTDDIMFHISGNGKVGMAINAKKIQAKVSGIGKLTLSGTANEFNLSVSGSSKIYAENLVVNKADVSISGVGKTYMDVKDELNLSISGTASFYYKAEPAKIKTNISGIGKYGTFEQGHQHDLKVVIGDDNDEVGASAGDNDSSDVTEVHVSKHRKARSHWGGLDLGFNQLLVGNNFSTNLPDAYDYLELNSGKSLNVNLNLYYHDFKIYKRYIMFTTGIGLTLNNYRFSSDKTLRADTNMVYAALDYNKSNEKIVYEKNKLAVNYFTVPLLLQFNSSKYDHNSFHVAAGALVSYKFNSHLKLVYNDEGDREKTKRRDEYNIEPFRTDLTLRIGYSFATVYASYAVTELFKNNRGPELHPFTVGISLVNW